MLSPIAAKYSENSVHHESKRVLSFDHEAQLMNQNQECSVTPGFINKIGLKLHAEIRGIERVTEEQKQNGFWAAPISMFLAPNLAISALSTGMLGPTYFRLDFRTCVLCCLFFPMISAVPVGFFALFGTKFGLRQQILSRHLTGNLMGRVFALFSVMSCLGWNAVNVLPAVQMLVSLGPLPPWAGCLIFSVITCTLAFFGYKVIHTYQRYSWIPNLVVYLVIIARLCKSQVLRSEPVGGAEVTAGNVLSFITTIFGFVAGWSSSAADYFVYIPSDTPVWKMVLSMVIGMAIPCILTFILGAACAMGTFREPLWATAFQKNSVGGLVHQILVVDNLHGFGQFCMVILALSAVANNLPGSYSLSLSMQAIWSPLAKFPRLGWCIFGNFVSLGLSIPAYYVFAQTMSTFLSIISYNVSIYIGITFAEHFVYRKGFAGYDLSNFNDVNTIPVGIAGVFGFCCGITSTVLSMNHTWYRGVIARAISGDISFELNVAFAFVGYNLVRPFEIKYFGR